MRLIGNDIIDLSTLREHPRSGQSRFWRKLLAEEEYAWLSSREEPALDIWKLWALKESAYKCFFQLTGRRLYAPKQFSCRRPPAIPAATGFHVRMDTPAGVFYAKTWQSPTCILALCSASPPQLERAVWQVFPLAGRNARDLSQQLRTQSLRWVAQAWEAPENELAWDDSAGYPQLFRRGESLKAGFSLSHHGGWGMLAAIDPSSLSRI